MVKTFVVWNKNGDHPLDGVGDTVEDRAYPGTYYQRVEGAYVRYYRNPDNPGDALCGDCGRLWRDHGWIEVEYTTRRPMVVCPGTLLPAPLSTANL